MVRIGADGKRIQRRYNSIYRYIRVLNNESLLYTQN